MVIHHKDASKLRDWESRETQSHDSFIWDMTHSCETWLIHVRYDSFIWDMPHSYETWLIHMRHDSFMWDMIHLYETCLIHMRHDSFIWDMTHSYETWLVHMCQTERSESQERLKATTHSYETWRIHMGHDSFTGMWARLRGARVKWDSEACHSCTSIWINKSSVNPKSTSNQSSKPCTVLQYPSRKVRLRGMPLVHINPVIFWPLNKLCSFRAKQTWKQCAIRWGDGASRNFWFHEPKKKSIFCKRNPFP